jgi:hypothetical protein
MNRQERWTNKIECLNTCNQEGNPSGGQVRGVGLNIDWQDGPLGWDYDKNTYPEAVAPNGAFTEDVVLALIDRLEFFQTAAEGKFRCRENAVIITKLEECLMWMQKRHDTRVNRKVQGEHKA